MCNFSFFDKDGIVDDYICHMLEDLRNSVEYILVISNGYVERSGLQKLKRAADDVYCRANLGLDVGGYREGLFYIGFKKLAEYDEVVMLNYTFLVHCILFQRCLIQWQKETWIFGELQNIIR